MHAIQLLIGWVFTVYSTMIFIYVLLSWLPQVRDSPLGVLVSRGVEPYLSIFRKFIPPFGMMDLSPLIAILSLHFIEEGVIVVVGLIMRIV